MQHNPKGTRIGLFAYRELERIYVLVADSGILIPEEQAQVVNRLGMVFFLLFFNLGITIFVFLLTGMMLFSQILFIIFAMFLPISFLLSMIPSYESMAKQAIVREIGRAHV